MMSMRSWSGQKCGAVDTRNECILLYKGVVSGWTKPWLEEEKGALVANAEKTIYFPSTDNEAYINIGFFRQVPNRDDDITQFSKHILRMTALNCLLTYLTESSVTWSQLGQGTAFYFVFNGVSVEKVKEVKSKFYSVLEEQIVSFDMVRMKDILNNHIVNAIYGMESWISEDISSAFIGDFLYGNTKNMFIERMNTIPIALKLLDAPHEFWTTMIGENLLDIKSACIIALPNPELHTIMEKKEQKRINERKLKLGESGLAYVAQVLELAVIANETAQPAEILKEVKVPSISRITFYKIKTKKNPSWASKVKCSVITSDVKSNFVLITIQMDASSLSMEQKKYLPIFCEALTESPVSLSDGTQLSSKDVISALKREFIWYTRGVGVTPSGVRFDWGQFSHIITFSSTFEITKIEVCLGWIRNILTNTKWDTTKLKHLANKLLKQIILKSRDGGRMAVAFLKNIVYEKESNTRQASLIRQQIFLMELLESFEESKETLKENLDLILKELTKPQNMSIFMAASMVLVDKFFSENSNKSLSLRRVFENSFCFHNGTQIFKRISNELDFKWLKARQHLRNDPVEIIWGLASEESSHLLQVIPGFPLTTDRELPAVLVAISYFSQTEGPLWRAIRGRGLAYHFNLRGNTTEGLLYFSLGDSLDLVQAYKVSQDVIAEHASKNESWSDELFTSAKSSLIFEQISGESTPLGLALMSLINIYKKLSHRNTQKMIKEISKVKMKQLKPITEKYLLPLFTGCVNCAISCSLDKVETVIEGMNKLGRNFIIVPVNDQET